MAYVHLEDIGITGIAVAVPKNVINNRDLAEKFGEKHINKFIRTTGVIQRRIAVRTPDSCRISDWRQHKSY